MDAQAVNIGGDHGALGFAGCHHRPRFVTGFADQHIPWTQIKTPLQIKRRNRLARIEVDFTRIQVPQADIRRAVRLKLDAARAVKDIGKDVREWEGGGKRCNWRLS